MSNKKNSNKEESNLDKIISNMRNFWWKYVIHTISFGITLLFIASLIFDKSITINYMNSWVGIILGLVASVIGIISMFLSFYNLDQSIHTQEATLARIDFIKKEIIDYIEKSSKATIDEIHNSNKPEIRSPKGGGWNEID